MGFNHELAGFAAVFDFVRNISKGDAENLWRRYLRRQLKKRRERGKSHRGAEKANTGEVVRN